MVLAIVELSVIFILSHRLQICAYNALLYKDKKYKGRWC